MAVRLNMPLPIREVLVYFCKFLLRFLLIAAQRKENNSFGSRVWKLSRQDIRTIFQAAKNTCALTVAAETGFPSTYPKRALTIQVPFTLLVRHLIRGQVTERIQLCKGI
jgi:hypothetical protein